MAKAKAAKKSKEKNVEKPVASFGNDVDEIRSLEAEIQEIKKSEIIPRRRRIAELRSAKTKSQSECNHENIQRIQGSTYVKCQNSECGKMFRLQG